jgi:hypothetical protein
MFEFHISETSNFRTYLFPKRQIVEQLVRICSNKSMPIGLLFLVTILPLGAYLG